MNSETLIAVASKELRLFFGSPIGYLFIAAYLGLTLFVFFWVETFFARNISDVRPMFESLPVLLIFLCSALTMRIWSDERRTGTLEFIVTLPVTPWELVLGKFAACMTLLILSLLLTLPLPISVAVVGNLDWGPVGAAYSAALLLGAAYLSIGLFVSSRSENQIVTLIISVLVCGVFYMLGSTFLTSLVGTNFADFLSELGSGSRFESITRGVLDVTDFYYYISITASFLVLNVFAVEMIGWTKRGAQERHLNRSFICGLVVLNLVVANIWIAQLPPLRWDVTAGQQYTMSDVSKQELAKLQEPLLIRGYFSAKTHRLLAPLVPQLRDLMSEYSIFGGRNVVVEFIDPVLHPELEDEANKKYGIQPDDFEVEDRYQRSIVKSYFHILIRYGDEFEVLRFQDLIEVKAEGEMELDVQLRNPEYDITRAIARVRSEFQAGGSIFDSVPGSVEFTGYISAEDWLPPELIEVKNSLVEALDEIKENSAGKFSWQILDPIAGDGSLAREIAENFGFQPMAASLFDLNQFYFYLTLSDGASVVSMRLPDSRDVEGFKRLLEEGVKPFTEGLLTSVAIYTSTPSVPQYTGQPQPTARFNDMSGYLRGDYEVQTVDLRGPVPSHADVLMVIGPNDLDQEQVFEIDQFLMRGGTVLIATSAFTTSLMDRTLLANRALTGLDDWLAHHGVNVEQTMVMDVNSGVFPIPVQREVGGFIFEEIQMFDYPFFVDVRHEGFVDDHPIVNNLDQVIFAWGSPLTVDEELNSDREVIEILRSSKDSWTNSAPELMPKYDPSGNSPYVPGIDLEPKLLAVSVKGIFTSFFEESPLLVAAREQAAAEAAAKAAADAEELDADSTETSIPDEENLDVESLDDENTDDDALMEELQELQDGEDDSEAEEDTLGVIGTVISRSPESARLVVLGSSDSLSDIVLNMIGQTHGTIYTQPLQFVANVIDVSMEDSSLLSIRSRGHFSRTLPPLKPAQQRTLEIMNYIFAILGLMIVAGVSYLSRRVVGNQRSQWFGANR
ncbi:MAG: ABC transporter permease subunit [Gammaproteobacteria bacterium]|nr:ABC transporter permease subunit [Gammaproteobacteria bacterium]